MRRCVSHAVLAVAAGLSVISAGCGSDEAPSPASTKLRTPNVLHERPAEARSQLEQLGVVTRFSFLGIEDRPCAGLPPAGTIVRQEPKAGAEIEPGQIARVQTSCGPPRTDAQCRARDLRLKVLANND